MKFHTISIQLKLQHWLALRDDAPKFIYKKLDVHIKEPVSQDAPLSYFSLSWPFFNILALPIAVHFYFQVLLEFVHQQKLPPVYGNIFDFLLIFVLKV